MASCAPCTPPPPPLPPRVHPAHTSPPPEEVGERDVGASAEEDEDLTEEEAPYIYQAYAPGPSQSFYPQFPEPRSERNLSASHQLSRPAADAPPQYSRQQQGHAAAQEEEKEEEAPLNRPWPLAGTVGAGHSLPPSYSAPRDAMLVRRNSASSMVGHAQSSNNDLSRSLDHAKDRANQLRASLFGEKAAGRRQSAITRRTLAKWHIKAESSGYTALVWARSKASPTIAAEVNLGRFASYEEAELTCECYSPPMRPAQSGDDKCNICGASFGMLYRSKRHCRNCAQTICTNCSKTQWPTSMVPFTYFVKVERKLRICDACAVTTEAFRNALLAGDEEAAIAAYSTGLVNLRTPYTIYHSELPLHCAAKGGNLSILTWLLEDRRCPLFQDAQGQVPLVNGARLTVLGVAAAAGHLEIMREMITKHHCKVSEITDLNALWSTLEKALALVPQEGREDTPVAVAVAVPVVGQADSGDSDMNDCIVCFERPRDTCLQPCGHVACCRNCAAQFNEVRAPEPAPPKLIARLINNYNYVRHPVHLSLCTYATLAALLLVKTHRSNPSTNPNPNPTSSLCSAPCFCHQCPICRTEIASIINTINA
ncbi:unnamed protein product [Chrysoparadoxa australica]